MRRRVVSGVTLLVLCLLLVTGAVFGWRALFAPVEDDAARTSPSPTCSTAPVDPGTRIRTRDVTVSVFNAGSISGLAQDTERRLARRGFQRGEVGNAPEAVAVEFVQVWTSQDRDAAARLVARQFGPDTLIRYGARDLGPGIDVVVGNRFRGLVEAPRSVRVREPQTLCVR